MMLSAYENRTKTPCSNRKTVNDDSWNIFVRQCAKFRYEWLKFSYGRKTPETARLLAERLHNFIVDTPHHMKLTRGFLKLILRQFLSLHSICCEIADDTNIYILDVYMKKGLVLYIMLELEIAKKPKYLGKKDYELSLKERVTTLLWTIYSKYYYSFTGRTERIEIWEIIWRFLDTELPPSLPNYFNAALIDMRKIFLSEQKQPNLLNYYTERDDGRKTIDRLTDPFYAECKLQGIDIDLTGETTEPKRASLEVTGEFSGELSTRLKKLQTLRPQSSAIIHKVPTEIHKSVRGRNVKAKPFGGPLNDSGDKDERSIANVSKLDNYKPLNEVIDLTDDDDDKFRDNFCNADKVPEKLVEETRLLLSKYQKTGIAIKIIIDDNVELDSTKTVKVNAMNNVQQVGMCLVHKNDSEVVALKSASNSPIESVDQIYINKKFQTTSPLPKSLLPLQDKSISQSRAVRYKNGASAGNTTELANLRPDSLVQFSPAQIPITNCSAGESEATVCIADMVRRFCRLWSTPQDQSVSQNKSKDEQFRYLNESTGMANSDKESKKSVRSNEKEIGVTSVKHLPPKTTIDSSLAEESQIDNVHNSNLSTVSETPGDSNRRTHDSVHHPFIQYEDKAREHIVHSTGNDLEPLPSQSFEHHLHYEDADRGICSTDEIHGKKGQRSPQNPTLNINLQANADNSLETKLKTLNQKDSFKVKTEEIKSNFTDIRQVQQVTSSDVSSSGGKTANDFSSNENESTKICVDVSLVEESQLLVADTPSTDMSKLWPRFRPSSSRENTGKENLPQNVGLSTIATRRVYITQNQSKRKVISESEHVTDDDFLSSDSEDHDVNIEGVDEDFLLEENSNEEGQNEVKAELPQCQEISQRTISKTKEIMSKHNRIENNKNHQSLLVSQHKGDSQMQNLECDHTSPKEYDHNIPEVEVRSSVLGSKSSTTESALLTEKSLQKEKLGSIGEGVLLADSQKGLDTCSGDTLAPDTFLQNSLAKELQITENNKNIYRDSAEQVPESLLDSQDQGDSQMEKLEGDHTSPKEYEQNISEDEVRSSVHGSESSATESDFLTGTYFQKEELENIGEGVLLPDSLKSLDTCSEDTLAPDTLLQNSVAKEPQITENNQNVSTDLTEQVSQSLLVSQDQGDQQMEKLEIVHTSPKEYEQNISEVKVRSSVHGSQSSATESALLIEQSLEKEELINIVEGVLLGGSRKGLNKISCLGDTLATNTLQNSLAEESEITGEDINVSGSESSSKVKPTEVSNAFKDITSFQSQLSAHLTSDGEELDKMPCSEETLAANTLLQNSLAKEPQITENNINISTDSAEQVSKSLLVSQHKGDSQMQNLECGHTSPKEYEQNMPEDEVRSSVHGSKSSATESALLVEKSLQKEELINIAEGVLLEGSGKRLDNISCSGHILAANTLSHNSLAKEPQITETNKNVSSLQREDLENIGEGVLLEDSQKGLDTCSALLQNSLAKELQMTVNNKNIYRDSAQQVPQSLLASQDQGDSQMEKLESVHTSPKEYEQNISEDEVRSSVHHSESSATESDLLTDTYIQKEELENIGEGVLLPDSQKRLDTCSGDTLAPDTLLQNSVAKEPQITENNQYVSTDLTEQVSQSLLVSQDQGDSQMKKLESGHTSPKECEQNISEDEVRSSVHGSQSSATESALLTEQSLEKEELINIAKRVLLGGSRKGLNNISCSGDTLATNTLQNSLAEESEITEEDTNVSGSKSISKVEPTEISNAFKDITSFQSHLSAHLTSDGEELDKMPCSEGTLAANTLLQNSLAKEPQITENNINISTGSAEQVSKSLLVPQHKGDSQMPNLECGHTSPKEYEQNMPEDEVRSSVHGSKSSATESALLIIEKSLQKEGLISIAKEVLLAGSGKRLDNISCSGDILAANALLHNSLAKETQITENNKQVYPDSAEQISQSLVVSQDQGDSQVEKLESGHTSPTEYEQNIPEDKVCSNVHGSETSATQSVPLNETSLQKEDLENIGEDVLLEDSQKGLDTCSEDTLAPDTLLQNLLAKELQITESNKNIFRDSAEQVPQSLLTSQDQGDSQMEKLESVHTSPKEYEQNISEDEVRSSVHGSEFSATESDLLTESYFQKEELENIGEGVLLPDSQKRLDTCSGETLAPDTLLQNSVAKEPQITENNQNVSTDLTEQVSQSLLVSQDQGDSQIEKLESGHTSPKEYEQNISEDEVRSSVHGSQSSATESALLTEQSLEKEELINIAKGALLGGSRKGLNNISCSGDILAANALLHNSLAKEPQITENNKQVSPDSVEQISQSLLVSQDQGDSQVEKLESGHTSPTEYEQNIPEDKVCSNVHGSETSATQSVPLNETSLQKEDLENIGEDVLLEDSQKELDTCSEDTLAPDTFLQNLLAKELQITESNKNIYRDSAEQVSQSLLVSQDQGDSQMEKLESVHTSPKEYEQNISEDEVRSSVLGSEFSATESDLLTETYFQKEELENIGEGVLLPDSQKRLDTCSGDTLAPDTLLQNSVAKEPQITENNQYVSTDLTEQVSQSLLVSQDQGDSQMKKLESGHTSPKECEQNISEDEVRSSVHGSQSSATESALLTEQSLEKEELINIAKRVLLGGSRKGLNNISCSGDTLATNTLQNSLAEESEITEEDTNVSGSKSISKVEPTEISNAFKDITSFQSHLSAHLTSDGEELDKMPCSEGTLAANTLLQNSLAKEPQITENNINISTGSAEQVSKSLLVPQHKGDSQMPNLECGHTSPKEYEQNMPEDEVRSSVHGSKSSATESALLIIEKSLQKEGLISIAKEVLLAGSGKRLDNISCSGDILAANALLHNSLAKETQITENNKQVYPDSAEQISQSLVVSQDQGDSQVEKLESGHTSPTEYEQNIPEDKVCSNVHGSETSATQSVPLNETSLQKEDLENIGEDVLLEDSQKGLDTCSEDTLAPDTLLQNLLAKELQITESNKNIFRDSAEQVPQSLLTSQDQGDSQMEKLESVHTSPKEYEQNISEDEVRSSVHGSEFSATESDLLTESYFQKEELENIGEGVLLPDSQKRLDTCSGETLAPDTLLQNSVAKEPQITENNQNVSTDLTEQVSQSLLVSQDQGDSQIEKLESGHTSPKEYEQNISEDEVRSSVHGSQSSATESALLTEQSLEKEELINIAKGALLGGSRKGLNNISCSGDILAANALLHNSLAKEPQITENNKQVSPDSVEQISQSLLVSQDQGDSQVEKLESGHTSPTEYEQNIPEDKVCSNVHGSETSATQSVPLNETSLQKEDLENIGEDVLLEDSQKELDTCSEDTLAPDTFLQNLLAKELQITESNKNIYRDSAEQVSQSLLVSQDQGDSQMEKLESVHTSPKEYEQNISEDEVRSSVLGSEFSATESDLLTETYFQKEELENIGEGVLLPDSQARLDTCSGDILAPDILLQNSVAKELQLTENNKNGSPDSAEQVSQSLLVSQHQGDSQMEKLESGHTSPTEYEQNIPEDKVRSSVHVSETSATQSVPLTETDLAEQVSQSLLVSQDQGDSQMEKLESVHTSPKEYEQNISEDEVRSSVLGSEFSATESDLLTETYFQKEELENIGEGVLLPDSQARLDTCSGDILAPDILLQNSVAKELQLTENNKNGSPDSAEQVSQSLLVSQHQGDSQMEKLESGHTSPTEYEQNIPEDKVRSSVHVSETSATQSVPLTETDLAEQVSQSLLVSQDQGDSQMEKLESVHTSPKEYEQNISEDEVRSSVLGSEFSATESDLLTETYFQKEELENIGEGVLLPDSQARLDTCSGDILASDILLQNSVAKEPQITENNKNGSPDSAEQVSQSLLVSQHQGDSEMEKLESGHTSPTEYEQNIPEDKVRSSVHGSETSATQSVPLTETDLAEQVSQSLLVSQDQGDPQIEKLEIEGEQLMNASEGVLLAGSDGDKQDSSEDLVQFDGLQQSFSHVTDTILETDLETVDNRPSLKVEATEIKNNFIDVTSFQHQLSANLTSDGKDYLGANILLQNSSTKQQEITQYQNSAYNKKSCVNILHNVVIQEAKHLNPYTKKQNREASHKLGVTGKTTKVQAGRKARPQKQHRVLEKRNCEEQSDPQMEIKVIKADTKRKSKSPVIDSSRITVEQADQFNDTGRRALPQNQHRVLEKSNCEEQSDPQMEIKIFKADAERKSKSPVIDSSRMPVEQADQFNDTGRRALPQNQHRVLEKSNCEAYSDPQMEIRIFKADAERKSKSRVIDSSRMPVEQADQVNDTGRRALPQNQHRVLEKSNCKEQSDPQMEIKVFKAVAEGKSKSPVIDSSRIPVEHADQFNDTVHRVRNSLRELADVALQDAANSGCMVLSHDSSNSKENGDVTHQVATNNSEGPGPARDSSQIPFSSVFKQVEGCDKVGISAAVSQEGQSNISIFDDDDDDDDTPLAYRITGELLLHPSLSQSTSSIPTNIPASKKTCLNVVLSKSSNNDSKTVNEKKRELLLHPSSSQDTSSIHRKVPANKKESLNVVSSKSSNSNSKPIKEKKRKLRLHHSLSQDAPSIPAKIPESGQISLDVVSSESSNNDFKPVKNKRELLLLSSLSKNTSSVPTKTPECKKASLDVVSSESSYNDSKSVNEKKRELLLHPSLSQNTSSIPTNIPASKKTCLNVVLSESSNNDSKAVNEKKRELLLHPSSSQDTSSIHRKVPANKKESLNVVSSKSSNSNSKPIKEKKRKLRLHHSLSQDAPSIPAKIPESGQISLDVVLSELSNNDSKPVKNKRELLLLSSLSKNTSSVPTKTPECKKASLDVVLSESSDNDSKSVNEKKREFLLRPSLSQNLTSVKTNIPSKTAFLDAIPSGPPNNESKTVKERKRKRIAKNSQPTCTLNLRSRSKSVSDDIVQNESVDPVGVKEKSRRLSTGAKGKNLKVKTPKIMAHGVAMENVPESNKKITESSCKTIQTLSSVTKATLFTIAALHPKKRFCFFEQLQNGKRQRQGFEGHDISFNDQITLDNTSSKTMKERVLSKDASLNKLRESQEKGFLVPKEGAAGDKEGVVPETSKNPLLALDRIDSTKEGTLLSATYKSKISKDVSAAENSTVIMSQSERDVNFKLQATAVKPVASEETTSKIDYFNKPTINGDGCNAFFSNKVINSDNNIANFIIGVDKLPDQENAAIISSYSYEPTAANECSGNKKEVEFSMGETFGYQDFEINTIASADVNFGTDVNKVMQLQNTVPDYLSEVIVDGSNDPEDTDNYIAIDLIEQACGNSKSICISEANSEIESPQCGVSATNKHSTNTPEDPVKDSRVEFVLNDKSECLQACNNSGYEKMESECSNNILAEVSKSNVQQRKVPEFDLKYDSAEICMVGEYNTCIPSTSKTNELENDLAKEVNSTKLPCGSINEDYEYQNKASEPQERIETVKKGKIGHSHADTRRKDVVRNTKEVKKDERENMKAQTLLKVDKLSPRRSSLSRKSLEEKESFPRMPKTSENKTKIDSVEGRRNKEHNTEHNSFKNREQNKIITNSQTTTSDSYKPLCGDTISLIFDSATEGNISGSQLREGSLTCQGNLQNEEALISYPVISIPDQKELCVMLDNFLILPNEGIKKRKASTDQISTKRKSSRSPSTEDLKRHCGEFLSFPSSGSQSIPDNKSHLELPCNPTNSSSSYLQDELLGWFSNHLEPPENETSSHNNTGDFLINGSFVEPDPADPDNILNPVITDSNDRNLVESDSVVEEWNNLINNALCDPIIGDLDLIDKASSANSNPEIGCKASNSSSQKKARISVPRKCAKEPDNSISGSNKANLNSPPTSNQFLGSTSLMDSGAKTREARIAEIPSTAETTTKQPFKACDEVKGSPNQLSTSRAKRGARRRKKKGKPYTTEQMDISPQKISSKSSKDHDFDTPRPTTNYRKKSKIKRHKSGEFEGSSASADEDGESFEEPKTDPRTLRCLQRLISANPQDM